MMTRFHETAENNFTTQMIQNSTTVTWIPFLDPINKVKIGMAVGMLISVYIVTLLPYILIRCLSKKWEFENREKSKYYIIFTTWMSRINCFAGGVFLSTGFMDIFPEMLESIEKAKSENKIDTTFPIGPFLTLLGFFMILIIEETITFIKNEFFSTEVRTGNEDLNESISHPGTSSRKSQMFNYNTLDENEFQNNQISDGKTDKKRHLHDHSIDHTHHEHHDHELDKDALSRGNLSVAILMIAISIHSIFEGLALGLEKTSKGASRLFLALCLHKYIIAITIGLQISKSTLGAKMACLCSGIFSLGTPLGVILGFWVIYLQEHGNTEFSIVAGILQGIACGTFFYIVFFEILPEEFSKRRDKLIKTIALILGFTLISLVMYFFH